MGANCVVGIDASTTAVKAIVFDAGGVALSEGRAAIALDNPEPDGWEQDAEQWWSALGEACRGALHGIDATRLAALCIAHQRETIVVTDAEARPLHPALVWMDKRCMAQVERAVAVVERERLRALSGKPPCTTPSLYKLMYLLERRPALRAPGVRALDVHALLAWRLTGRCATSLAAADPTGMLDMQMRAWSPELVALTGLDDDALPELVEPGAMLGAVSTDGARHTGLPVGLPVIAGAGDGQAAGLGAGIVAPGRAYLNLGTAVVSGVLSHSYETGDAYRTLYAADGNGYFLETDLQGGTFTIDWLIERFLGRAPGGRGAEHAGSDDARFAEALAELDRHAAKLPPGAEGLMLVPYFNGVMNPYWDDDASAIMLGLRGHHEPAHVFRAILEGIAFEQRLHTEGVERAVGDVRELVVMGGGSKSRLWCQIVADVMQKPVVRAGTSEATCLGAAILAACGAGIHAGSSAACAAMTRTGERFEPGPAAERYDQLYRDIYSGLYLDVRARMRRLAELTRG